MTLEDIGHRFALMAAEAAEKGDDSLLPRAVLLLDDAWRRIPYGRPIPCTNILHGIRDRGVRVNVSSQ